MRDIENSKKSKRLKICLHLDSAAFYYSFSIDPLTLSPQSIVNATLGHKDFGLFRKKAVSWSGNGSKVEL